MNWTCRYMNISNLIAGRDDENSKNDYIKFIDLDKFVQFNGIFTKRFTAKAFPELRRGNTDELDLTDELRKKFVYGLFDLDKNDTIDKLEFRNFINAFVEMILQANFKNEAIQSKIDGIIKNVPNIQNIEKSLDVYVNDQFQAKNSSDSETLTYYEWDIWIGGVEGINEILKFAQEAPKKEENKKK